MKLHRLIPQLALILSVAAGSHTLAAQSAATAAAPVAFIYVSGASARPGVNILHAYSAAANGRLTAIPGSPFADNLYNMAVNGKYLFGLNRNGIYIAQFFIEPNGALRWKQSIKPSQYDQSGCNGPIGPLVLDHSGSTLYVELNDFFNCGSDVYQSFQVERPSGNLKFLGNNRDLGLFSGPISFIGNNVYAYGAECDFYVGLFVPIISGFQRQANGNLGAGAGGPIPASQQPDRYLFCPLGTAADATNHVAIAMQLEDTYTDLPSGPVRLAAYTADSSGNLSTASTYVNMASSAVGAISLSMAPSGKLLAVSGPGGLQVFHFNGGNNITHYTGALTRTAVLQSFWDNANHLYAIDGSKLYVFTITPTSVSQAPGSPHALPGAQNLIVQPKTSRP